MDHALTINFALPSSSRSPFDALILEQEEWHPGTGMVTALDFVKELAHTLYGSEQGDTHCGVSGGCFDVVVYAYPFNPALAYHIGATHGELSEATVEEIEVREALNFSLDDKATAKYPVQSIISAELMGDCWDAAGAVTGLPVVFFAGQEVTLSKKVYGSVIIKYMILRHRYNLHITARTETPENVFQSVVWANWAGGVKLLEIDPPHGAEDDQEMNVECWARGGGTVTYPDHPALPPTTDGVTRTKKIDYCSKQLISDSAL